MLADQAVQCVSLSVLFLSPSIRLSFISLERHNPDFKNELLPISPYLLSAFLSTALFFSFSLSLSLFLPCTLFLLVKTESILESENRLSVSAPLRSLLDKGIQSPLLLLLHLLAFLESFTQPSTFFLSSFFFFFPLGAVQRVFPIFGFGFLHDLLLFMSQG